MIMNNTRIGNYAESLFDSECLIRDIVASKPVSETYYDRLIEVNGELKKVQIKCVTVERDYAKVIFRYKLFNRSKEKVDYYAVYFIKNNSWYFFPYSSVTSVRISLRSPRNENKNNWEVLK